MHCRLLWRSAWKWRILRRGPLGGWRQWDLKRRREDPMSLNDDRAAYRLSRGGQWRHRGSSDVSDWRHGRTMNRGGTGNWRNGNDCTSSLLYRSNHVSATLWNAAGEHELQGTKVCRYNWHSAGSLGWPFPMIKYKHIFQKKYTEAILSNSTRKLLRCDITKMLIAG